MERQQTLSKAALTIFFHLILSTVGDHPIPCLKLTVIPIPLSRNQGQMDSIRPIMKMEPGNNIVVLVKITEKFLDLT